MVFNKKDKQVVPTWNSSVKRTEKSSSKTLPWKKCHSHFDKMDINCADTEFTDMNLFSDDDGSETPSTRYSPNKCDTSKKKPQERKYCHVVTEETNISKNSNAKDSKVIFSVHSPSLLQVKAQGKKMHGNRQFSRDRTRRISSNSNSSSSGKRFPLDDGDKSHQHNHLFVLEVDGLDIKRTMTPLSNSSDIASNITPLSTHRSALGEGQLGNGWSVGVHKFDVNESCTVNSTNTSIFTPSNNNVAMVPSASHTRKSLLKREFGTIKQALSNSYRKYRDKSKNATCDEKHAITYQYVDKWLKRNKKASLTSSRISKNEMQIFYQVFLKKVQSFFPDPELKVLDVEAMTDELVKNKNFLGKYEANNFLLKIKLDDKGSISLNDFRNYIESSGTDVQLTQLKSFVKGVKKVEDRVRKLEEARTAARESHRQQLAQQEAAATADDLKRSRLARTNSRGFSVVSRNNSGACL